MLSKTKNSDELMPGDRAVIIEIKGPIAFQQYLLANGISLGTVMTKNYSPAYAKLINITVGNKMIGIREADFKHIQTIKMG